VQGEPGPPFPELGIKGRFLVTRGGYQPTLYAGLVDALHSVSRGSFELTADIAQLPSEANGMTAVVTARAAIYDAADHDRRLRLATAIGDASPQSVDPRLATALVRTAETRAKARALRDLLNVAAVWVGELGPEDLRTPADDTIRVGGQLYSRHLIWDAYRRRVALARERGFPVEPEEAGRGADDPLPVLVAVTQALKRRMDQRGPPGPPPGGAGKGWERQDGVPAGTAVRAGAARPASDAGPAPEPPLPF
jgi:hypothetical protein